MKNLSESDDRLAEVTKAAVDLRIQQVKKTIAALDARLELSVANELSWWVSAFVRSMTVAAEYKRCASGHVDKSLQEALMEFLLHFGVRSEITSDDGAENEGDKGCRDSIGSCGAALPRTGVWG